MSRIWRKASTGRVTSREPMEIYPSGYARLSTDLVKRMGDPESVNILTEDRLHLIGLVPVGDKSGQRTLSTDGDYGMRVMLPSDTRGTFSEWERAIIENNELPEGTKLKLSGDPASADADLDGQIVRVWFLDAGNEAAWKRVRRGRPKHVEDEEETE